MRNLDQRLGCRRQFPHHAAGNQRQRTTNRIQGRAQLMLTVEMNSFFMRSILCAR